MAFRWLNMFAGTFPTTPAGHSIECDTRAPSNESCIATEAETHSKHTFDQIIDFLKSASPAHTENALTYLVVSIVVTFVLALILYERETPLQKQKRRIEFEKILSGLAQVNYEYNTVSKQLTEYNEKKEKLRTKAKQMAAEMNMPDKEDSIFENLLSEHHIDLVGGEEKDPPVRITAYRFFEVVVSKSDECLVSKIPYLERSFASQREKKNFEENFVEATRLLRDTQIYEIEKCLLKTAKSRGQIYRDGKIHGEYDVEKQLAIGDFQHSSGLKLETLLEDMKKMDKVLRPKGLFGRNRVMEGESQESFKRHKAALGVARSYYKDIRKGNISRFARLVSYLDCKSVWYLFVQLFMQGLLAMQWPIWSYFEKKIIDAASSPDWKEIAFKEAFGFWIIDVFHMLVIHNVRIVCEEKLNARFRIKIKEDLFAAILRQDMFFFKTNDSGAIQSLLKHDCDRVSESFLMLPNRFFQGSMSILSFAVAIYIKSPLLLWRSFCVVAAIVPIIVYIFSFSSKTQQAIDNKGRLTSKHTDEMLRNVQTVREFAREKIETDEYKYSQYSEAQSHIKCHLLGHAGWVFFVVFARGAVSWNQMKSVELVQLGTLEPTDILFLCNYIWGFVHIVRHWMVDLFPEFSRSLAPAERVFSVIERRSTIESNPGDKERLDISKNLKNGGLDIEVKDISFAYPTMPEHRVMRGLSMHIPAGKTTALCGERGCGKSTTLSLIQRHYDINADSGCIEINGKPLQAYEPRTLRKVISVVAQKVNLFDGTIKENILYGVSVEEQKSRGFNVSDDEYIAFASEHGIKNDSLIYWCEMACCWDFISDFPLKLETRIGTGGVTLSGGQEQCIAICRALIKRPAALILDEYTAALDGPTQKRVASNIAKLQKDFGFTIVQIAHRLETLTNSDCLYFLEHGKVVESIMTDDRSATKALLKVPIKHRATINGLTGENMEKVTAGFFHATWNSNFDVKDIHKMKLNDLEKREKELEEELTLVRDVSLKKRSSDDLDNFLGAPPTRLPQICCKATSSLSSDYNEYNHNSSSSNSNEGA